MTDEKGLYVLRLHCTVDLAKKMPKTPPDLTIRQVLGTGHVYMSMHGGTEAERDRAQKWCEENGIEFRLKD